MMDEPSPMPVNAEPTGTEAAILPESPQNPIDLDRELHFSEDQSFREPDLTQGRPEGMTGFSAHAPNLAIFVVIATVWSSGSSTLSSWIGLGPALVLAMLIPVAIIAAVLWLERRTRGPALGPAELARIQARLARVTDLRRRLCACVFPQQVPMLENLSDSPFEPRIFRFPFAPPPNGRHRILAFVVMIPVSIAIVFSVPRAFGFTPSLGAELVFAVIILTTLPFLVLWPTYFRLSPGRLDVMRFSIFGRGRPIVETFDLRRCRVMVNGRVGALLLTTPDGKQSLYVWGWLMRRRSELIVAIFEAARSRHPTPPLPDDALVG